MPASPQHFTLKRLLELAIQIQQVPAPTFKEGRRADLVRALFAAEGLRDVSRDSVNNVYGRLPGSQGVSPLIISAHLDTVFPDETLALSRRDHRIHGPGIGDNSLGVAALLGLL